MASGRQKTLQRGARSPTLAAATRASLAALSTAGESDAKPVVREACLSRARPLWEERTLTLSEFARARESRFE